VDVFREIIRIKLSNKAIHILRKCIAFIAIIGGIILNLSSGYAQKYSFAHYDIEDGLIQSQVNSIYQDNNHRLWVGTLGGACRFDGMDYYGISKATGLINNFISGVYCDKQGNVWFGTNKGLACLKNQKLQNFDIPPGLKAKWVNHLVQTADGTIWGIASSHLFKVNNNRIELVKVAGSASSVTTLAINKHGQLLVGVYAEGVYTLNGKQWQHTIVLPKQCEQIVIVNIIPDRQNPDKLYIQAFRYLFVFENNTFTPYAEALLKDAKRPFLSMEQDANNNLWIGTVSGAYAIKGDKLIRFDAGNGLSDASVSSIYRDRDNNLWMGTQGDGLYRYDGDDYQMFSQSTEIKGSPIVMAIGRDNSNNILLGIDGAGVAQFDNQTLKSLWAQADMPNARKVLCVYKDHTGIVWVGTSLGGIWKYDGKTFKVIKGTEHNSVNTITEDADGLIWMATPLGAYYFDRRDTIHSVGMNSHSSSILMMGRDSVLMGTQEGLVLLVNKKPVPGFKIKLLGTSTIYCIKQYKSLILIGTDDEGIFAWDKKTGRVRNYQVRDGLNANSIYSLGVDEHNLVWAGTGRGVSRLSIDERTLNCTVFSSSESKDRIIESNQNAIFYYNHQMLVGTTKGLAVYNTSMPVAPSSAPYIIINGIKLFEHDNAKSKVLNNPNDYNNIILSSAQNHLAISFLGVYLSSPESVTYQYRLTGLDDKFCDPVKNDVVDYPSLPPGHYTFEVRAIAGNGMVSKNTAKFRFEIKPPFYRTYIFQLGVILLLIFIGVALQNILHQRKIQRQAALEAMKREEKLKIRQQTAEDFHDDLGNKLTRITVLSDILDAKLEKDKTEQKKLVLQIKQNAAALYNGTRDILWAMDPKSDNLYEVLNHIKETGIEIFEDTHIDFTFEGISDELTAIKLPMEYSRNITMIFKELLNNALKHADAHNVRVEYSQPDKDEAKLRVIDDGTGFDTTTVSRGHGLNNVKARAKRVGGLITCASEKAKGTIIELTFRLNTKS
jgi:signal transduction histidine kinase/ligand-binding sensor domain-containing protein